MAYILSKNSLSNFTITGLALAMTITLGACGSSDKDKKDNSSDRKSETSQVDVTTSEDTDTEGEPSGTDSENDISVLREKDFHTGYTHYFPMNEATTPFTNTVDGKAAATCTDCPTSVEGKYNNRDRGAPHSTTPPTPPGIRITYLGGSNPLFTLLPILAAPSL